MCRTRERPKRIETAYRAPDGGKRGIWFAIFEYWMEYLGSGYWHSNPRIGDALLTQKVGDQNRTLSVVFNDAYGFMLKYQGPDDAVPQIALNPLDPSGTTSATIGGIDLDLPVKYFLSRELAIAVTKEYFDSGVRSNRVQWIPLPFDWPKPLVEFE